MHTAIRNAKKSLLTKPVGQGLDPRWQALTALGDFIKTDPDAVWTFIVESSAHDDEDPHAALATCLLEHLLEHHPKYRRLAQGIARDNNNMSTLLAMCW